jgi:hypothetical protein
MFTSAMKVPTDSLPSVQEISRSRVQPSNRVIGTGPHISPLSILDATVVTYSPAAGVWIFDAPTDYKAPAVTDLQASLAATLDAYPQMAGRLWWTPYDPTGQSGHTRRFRRPQLTWGTRDDPGIEFVVAECMTRLGDCIPDAASRVRIDGGWDTGFIQDMGLYPSGLADLALRNIGAPENPEAPGVIVQVTTFACGGTAISVALAHALGDATTLRTFVRDWSTVHQSRLAGAPIPQLSPVFDPMQLDALAAGDIDAQTPDATLVAAAKALPLHRFDYWNSHAGAPAWAAAATRVPPDYVAPPYEEAGVPLPWDEWDSTHPVARVMFHFSPDAIERMHAAASVNGTRVSRLDALLAFLWTANVRARGLKCDPGVVYLDMTLGMRARARPPLPDGFVGSPLVNIVATLPAATLATSTPDLATIAEAIRKTVAVFDAPHVLPAYLHDRAFAGCPHACWGAFLGARHSLITSWLGLQMYSINFGSGRPPRHVESIMPDVDGCIQIQEAGLAGEKGGKWYTETVGVRMHLRTDVMERIKADPMLHMYD